MRNQSLKIFSQDCGAPSKRNTFISRFVYWDLWVTSITYSTHVLCSKMSSNYFFWHQGRTFPIQCMAKMFWQLFLKRKKIYRCITLSLINRQKTYFLNMNFLLFIYFYSSLSHHQLMNQQQLKGKINQHKVCLKFSVFKFVTYSS